MDVVMMLKGRLAEAEDDVARLKAAIKAVEDAAPASASNGRSRQRKRTSTGAKPVILLGKVVSELRKHEDGLGTAALADKLGGDQSQILTLLKEAEGDQVKREGERRATRWLALSDDDKSATRAAEIRARDKAARR